MSIFKMEFLLSVQYTAYYFFLNEPEQCMQW